jgi:putative PIN family toxin of toxin-antitoxin system
MNSFDVVLDTNVVFSALYSVQGASYKILSLIGKEHFTYHLSVPLVIEYEEKLKEKRKILGLSLIDIDDIIDYLCTSGICHHEINIFWRPCLSNPDDEMILELGIHSKSEFIITNNIKDFKKIKGFRIKAITPNDFLKILRLENSL